MSGYPVYSGEVVIDATSGTFTVNAASKSITAQTYWHYDATYPLLPAIQTAIRTVAGLGGFLVTISATTGKVTFQNVAAATDCTLVFDATSMPYLGLSSGTVSIPRVSSATGAYQVRNLWRPDKYCADRAAPVGNVGLLEGDIITTDGRDGSTLTTGYEQRRRNFWRFDYLPIQKVFPTTNYTYEDAEGFWRYVLASGRRVNVVEDPTVSATPLGTYYPRASITTGFAPKRLGDAEKWYSYQLDLSYVGA